MEIFKIKENEYNKKFYMKMLVYDSCYSVFNRWKYYYVTKHGNYLTSLLMKIGDEDLLCFDTKGEAMEWIDKHNPT